MDNKEIASNMNEGTQPDPITPQPNPEHPIPVQPIPPQSVEQSQSFSFTQSVPQSHPINPAQSVQPISPAQPSQQPNSQPIGDTTGIAGASTEPKKDSKKKTLIICGIAGAIGLVVLVVVLLVVFLKGGNKTVSCTQSDTAMGVEVNGEVNVEVADGKILGGNAKVFANIKSLDERYKDYEEEMADTIIEGYKKRCEEGCEFNHDYVKGDHIEITLKYNSEGINDLVYAYGIEDMSAQEIANKVQEKLENTSGTTCKQN